jgi:DNA modification methylase
VSVILLRGDARELPLPDESVDLIACSPPYFGQRDYRDGGASLEGQIGSEETPGEYIGALLGCTREWMRVLKPGGSIFVNLSDSYYSGKGAPGKTTTDQKNAGRNARRTTRSPLDYGLDLPRKTLLGLPARYQIGCIDDLDLIVRRDNIWNKLNPTPESANDRCATSHEYIYHLVKQPHYYSAVDEIREPPSDYARPNNAARATPAGVKPKTFADTVNPLGKLPGSVWTLASQPLKVPAAFGLRHFAAWPMAVPRQIILGWSPPGICTECGEGRRPAVSSARTFDGQPRGDLPAWADPSAPRRTPSGAGHWRFGTDRRLTGYTCACPAPGAPMRPAIVADPFGGTGTTALVASMLGRTGISVDRSADYCRLAKWRTTDPSERAKALQVPKPPVQVDGQESLFGEASA